MGTGNGVLQTNKTAVRWFFCFSSQELTCQQSVEQEGSYESNEPAEPFLDRRSEEARRKTSNKNSKSLLEHVASNTTRCDAEHN